MYFSGKYFYKNVTFVASTPGQYLICASALDTGELNYGLYCYTVVVGISAPVINQSSFLPTGNVYINPSIPVSFSFSFNMVIKRPSKPGGIHLFDASTNLTVATLNSTNITNVFIKNNTITFNFGTVLQLYKTYYITIDPGKF